MLYIFTVAGWAVNLAERGRGPSSQPTTGSKGPHPFLARVLADSEAESLYATQFSRAEHWLLSEHVVRGADALIPGTGYRFVAHVD